MIEAALVTAIVGIGAVAMLELLAAGTVSNADSANLTTGLNLANNIHEYALGLSFDQVRALDGRTYAQPLDARGVPIATLPNWSQQVTAVTVNPDALRQTNVTPGAHRALRLTATVSYRNTSVCSLNWLILEVPQ